MFRAGYIPLGKEKAMTPEQHKAAVKTSQRTARGRGLPRYMWLHEILYNGIKAGKYPLGSLLPTEAQLSAEFGVSRHTVREATRRLVDAGMIVRYPSIGTVVKATQPQNQQPSYVAGVRSLDDIFSYTTQTRLEVFRQGRAVADTVMADTLHCELGSKWIQLDASRLQVENNRVLSYTRVYLRPEFEGLIPRLRGNHPSFFQMLRDDYGQDVRRVRQQIEAAPMPEIAAQQRDIEEGSPALLMVRAYYDAHNRLLVVSENYYIADRFKLQSDWTLDADP